MDKRLAKRHKRQVAREKERVRISEPDVRTPEERKAAREASRPAGVQGNASPLYARPGRTQSARPVESTAKADS